MTAWCHGQGSCDGRLAYQRLIRPLMHYKQVVLFVREHSSISPTGREYGVGKPSTANRKFFAPLLDVEIMPTCSFLVRDP